MKIMELEQTGKGKSKDRPVHYDISQVGYLQFDLIDSFDLFSNPFGLQDSAVDRISVSKLLILIFLTEQKIQNNERKVRTRNFSHRHVLRNRR